MIVLPYLITINLSLNEINIIIISSINWYKFLKHSFFFSLGIFWWRQYGWIYSFRFWRNLHEFKLWWLYKVNWILFVPCVDMFKIPTCWSSSNNWHLYLSCVFLILWICSLFFLERRKQRGKRGKKIVAQVEVAVTMMLKWLKSGIQDLEEVVKEMWMKQETIPQFL